jgi:metallo-beta-lactamase class B
MVYLYTFWINPFEVSRAVFIHSTVPSFTASFSLGNEKFELFYPGAGHTVDNIVVWLPRQQILFGGCLIKSELAKDLGNVAEADVKEWSRSIHRVMEKFPIARVIIPGHYSWDGFGLLQHTLNLLIKK